MRLSLVALMLIVGGGTADAQRNKRNETDAVERACTVTDCFLERDIRNFEVIDQTHVIVYTGAQRCAFYVEVQGTFCDLTFAPELYFSRNNERPDTLISRPRDPLGRNIAMDPLDTMEHRRRDLRICANDLTIQVHGGRFTESIGQGGVMAPSNPRISNLETQCRVSGVTSITDDQLLEFYVSRGVLAPPPPMGSGEIEVGEQTEPQSATPADEEETAEK
jgi:hypothetical protein